MTKYNFGDIVLMGFPFTDLQGVSKRPAIVLYDSGDQDILVARITTQDIKLMPIIKSLSGSIPVFLPNRMSGLVNRQQ